jgi:phosphatidylglycerophosphatase A
MKLLTEIIVTCFYIGKIKFAPGTFGSLIAFPFVIFLLYIFARADYVIPLRNYSLTESAVITMFIFLFLVIILLFCLGIYFSNQYINEYKIEDPKEIVIDELVGQMLVITLCMFSSVFIYSSSFVDKVNPTLLALLVSFIMPFILFRIFDIFKPWPINYIDDNVKGGLGVMLDDVVAAIFASIMHYAIIFILISYSEN